MSGVRHRWVLLPIRAWKPEYLSIYYLARELSCHFQGFSIAINYSLHFRIKSRFLCKRDIKGSGFFYWFLSIGTLIHKWQLNSSYRDNGIRFKPNYNNLNISYVKSMSQSSYRAELRKDRLPMALKMWWFQDACPNAYSYAYDDRSSTYTCHGLGTPSPSYIVRFCWVFVHHEACIY